MTDHFNRRILVVDDQESIHEDFRKILGASENTGASLQNARSAFFGAADDKDEEPVFELTCASQGQEGIEILNEAVAQGNPFAVAFVDVRMPPGIDGIQTIRTLWETAADLQVVICTAYSDYSFDEITNELGYSDRLLILKKPFDPVEVRQMACALTEKWNILQQVEQQMEDLRAANERAESANRAKSEFLANMSHEIRTPMNALLGYIDLMCDPESSVEERSRFSRTIKKSGEHLLAILNDILDISWIEASRLVVNKSDFSPFDLMHEVAALMRSQASERDLELRMEAPNPIPEVIEGDLVRVRQILLNLINTAVKFTPSGSIRVQMRLDDNDESDHRYLCFDVIDTGIGIPQAKLETIFEPFSQADTSSTRIYGGTGLGLTIAKRLALLLGGDLEVESKEGQGSRFTLRLYAGELKRASLRQYTPEECSFDRDDDDLAGVDVDSIELNGRVLVVEDVKFNQLLLGALLRKAGAKVVLAGDGREGYEKTMEAEAQGEPFDLILMDMQMPVMDGYEATMKLRNEGYTRPILALTAHAMTGDREKCLEAGCTDYATKPLERPRLLAVCRRLMELDRVSGALPATDDAAERREAS